MAPEHRATRSVTQSYRGNVKGSTKKGKNRSGGVGKWPLHDKKMFQWYHAQAGAIEESAIRAQATIIFREIHQDLPLPSFSSTWMQKWRCWYSPYYTESLAKSSAETVASSEEVVDDGANLTFSPRTFPTTVAEPSNQLRAAKLSALLHDTQTIASATHASSFVEGVCSAPIPPVFNIPDCDDDSLPSTLVI